MHRKVFKRKKCKKVIYLVVLIVLFSGLLHKVYEFSSRKAENQLKDWHDYKFMEYEKYRVGIGEYGAAVILNDLDEIIDNERLYKKSGFSDVVSNKISVNRSIPDPRCQECKINKYLTNLPKVSIIIIFHNEVLSVLLRTIHSIINRTPHELIHEIILVNDNSTEPELFNPLQKYVDHNFPAFVKVKVLNERKGLIVTRLEGAKIATGDVLVFFDAHIEVNVNWLPPLLEPIKKNRRIATEPVIDDFDAKTFQYSFIPASRGIFDWHFLYKEIKLRPDDEKDPVKPFPLPVMLGCAFAIDRIFFMEELGNYDNGLRIWNGENYELSFKLWLCADGLFKVPCSRVTHTFREINPSRKTNEDYVGRNFKRIAEVWLDDYKEILYNTEPHRYNSIDTGDLTKQKAIRERLKCKPFSYFLNEVAFDMIQRYPPFKIVPHFASGTLRSLAADRNLCVEWHYELDVPLVLEYCHPNNQNPSDIQHFTLTFHKQIISTNTDFCLDSYKCSLLDCHFDKGNQYWKYEMVSLFHLIIKLQSNAYIDRIHI